MHDAEHPAVFGRFGWLLQVSAADLGFDVHDVWVFGILEIEDAERPGWSGVCSEGEGQDLDVDVVQLVDLANRWLARPAETRQRYCQDPGSTTNGLERFIWQFVDAVERGILPEPDSGWPAAGKRQPATIDEAEQVVFERWCRYLESRRVAGDRKVRQAA